MAAKRNRVLPILVITLLLLSGAGVWFLMSGQELLRKEEGISPQLISQAQRRDIESNLLLSGEVIPAFQVEVKPEVGGKIQAIHVETGQQVKKGDLLVTIDDTDLLTEKAAAETEIEGARIAVEKDRGNYIRAKALYEEKLISKEVYANLEADLRISENTLEKAQSRLRSVEDRLAKTRIVAPADGTVLDIPVDEGLVVTAAASVNSGSVLMTFADLSRLLIDTHVNQMDISKVHKGQPVIVEMQGEEAEPVHAEIEFVAPLATVKNNIKGFQVQAVIKDNNGRLKPGMSVSMKLPIGHVQNAISVPVAAVFQENDEHVVYVHTPNAKVPIRRKVEVGLSNLSFAEIKSGLNEGEEILLVDPKLIQNRS